MKKSNRIQHLLTAGLLLTVVNLFSKLLGFLRDILISNYYGSTATTDAFFLAFSIPTILIGIFTASTDSAIIPQYSRILQSSSNGRLLGDRYFSNIISVLTLIGSIISLICLFFPQNIVFLFAPSFRGTQMDLACRYLRLFSFSGVFHIWYCFFCSYLFCYEKTGPRILLTALTNVFAVFALFLWHDENIYGLSLAYLMGSLLSAVVPIWASKQIGYRYSLVLSLRRYEFPSFIRLFLPIMGSALLADLLLYLDRFLASFLPAGNLSALNYASKVISIFDSISVVGIGAVLIPVFSRLQAEKKYSMLRFTSSAVYFCAVLVLLPISIFSIFYANELVSFLYFRGAFTKSALQIVSMTFRAYAPQILFSPLYTLLVKTLHSIGNTRFPFRVSLFTFIVNACLSFALTSPLGVSGIALATSVSQILGCGLLFWKISVCLGLASEFFHPINIWKLMLCTSAFPIVWMLTPVLGSSFLTLLFAGFGTLALYYFLAVLLFQKELVICKHALQKNAA